MAGPVGQDPEAYERGGSQCGDEQRAADRAVRQLERVERAHGRYREQQRERGERGGEQRTAATLVTLILSLCVLALLAMPLTWRRIALLTAALAAFVLLFPVPAVRTFYALELPHGAIGSTLLITALGAAALTGFWVLSRRKGRRTAETDRE